MILIIVIVGWWKTALLHTLGCEVECVVCKCAVYAMGFPAFWGSGNKIISRPMKIVYSLIAKSGYYSSVFSMVGDT